MYHIMLFHFKDKPIIKITANQSSTSNKYGDCGAIILFFKGLIQKSSLCYQHHLLPHLVFKANFSLKLH